VNKRQRKKKSGELVNKREFANFRAYYLKAYIDLKEALKTKRGYKINE
jgi:hypothetical protein